MNFKIRNGIFEVNYLSNSALVFNNKANKNCTSYLNKKFLNKSTLLYKYKNGNYFVYLYSDGTKIRCPINDKFLPIFPEIINLKITNKSLSKSKIYYELTRVNGKECSFNYEFLNNLEKGSELVIGGNPLSHKDLMPFLENMNKKDIICNLTINKMEFISNKKLVQMLIDKKLVKGISINISDCKDIDSIIDFLSKNNNIVISVINGIVDEKILEKLFDKNVKLQIIGYKYTNKGRNLFSKKIENNMNYLEKNIMKIIKRFKIVSFDNASIRQLKLKDKIDNFEELYLGDEGDFSLYIDLVKGVYSNYLINDSKYKIKKDIKEMFKEIKNNNKKYHVEYYLSKDNKKMLFATLKEDYSSTFFFDERKNDWAFGGVSFLEIKKNRNLEPVNKEIAFSISNKHIEDYYEEYFGIIIDK